MSDRDENFDKEISNQKDEKEEIQEDEEFEYSYLECMPTEIIGLIMNYLSRNDLDALRETSMTMNSHISAFDSHFETMLNPDILDQISQYLNFEDLKSLRQTSRKVKRNVDVLQYPNCVNEGNRFGRCGHYSCLVYAFFQDIDQRIPRQKHVAKIVANAIYGQNTSNFIKFVENLNIPMDLVFWIIESEVPEVQGNGNGRINIYNHGIISGGIVMYLIENYKDFITPPVIKGFLLKGDSDVANLLIESGYNVLEDAFRYYTLQTRTFLKDPKMGALRNLMDNGRIKLEDIINSLRVCFNEKIRLFSKYLVSSYKDCINFVKIDPSRTEITAYFILNHCKLDILVPFMEEMKITPAKMVQIVSNTWMVSSLLGGVAENKEYILKSYHVENKFFINYCLSTDPYFDPDKYVSWGYKDIQRDMLNMLLGITPSRDKGVNWSKVAELLQAGMFSNEIINTVIDKRENIITLSRYYEFQIKDFVGGYLNTHDARIAYLAFLYLNSDDFEEFVKECNITPETMMKIVELQSKTFEKFPRLPTKNNILFLVENVRSPSKELFRYIYNFFGPDIAVELKEKGVEGAEHNALLYFIENEKSLDEPLSMVKYKFVDERDLIELLSIRQDQRMFDIKHIFEVDALVSVFKYFEQRQDIEFAEFVALYAISILETSSFEFFLKECNLPWEYCNHILSKYKYLNHGKMTTCISLVKNINTNLNRGALYYIFNICGLDIVKYFYQFKVDSFENILLDSLVNNQKINEIIETMEIYHFDEIDVLFIASSDPYVLKRLLLKYEFSYDSLHNPMIQETIISSYYSADRPIQISLFKLLDFLPEVYEEEYPTDSEDVHSDVEEEYYEEYYDGPPSPEMDGEF
jgi:hypothetical protein